MRLIFYTLYKWFYYFTSLKDPHIIAVCLFAMLLAVNVFSVFVFIDTDIFEWNLLPRIGSLHYGIYIFSIIILVYLLFLKNNSYLQLEEKFDRIKHIKTVGNLLTILYIVVTVIISAWVLYMNRPIQELWVRQ